MSSSVHDHVKKNTRGEFGAYLRGLRTKTNLNLHGLAEKINSSPAWLSYLERGQRVPSWPLVEGCMDVFRRMGVSAEELSEFKILAKGEIMRKIFESDNGAAVGSRARSR